MHTYSGRLTYLLAILFLVGLLTGCSHGVFDNPRPFEPEVAETNVQTSAEPIATTPAATDTQSALRHKPAPPPADVWQRIRQGYRLGAVDNPRIDSAIRWFTANDGVIRKSSERATPLIHHIVEQVEQLGLPTELTLIPLLETGFRVHARSPYGALGPWQFMPATGRQYGLRRTAYLDQRRDLVLSTKAALNYLSDLHAQFEGDWLLAIAAYNGGPGNVKKALQGKRLSFWEIVDRLPKETQVYVPKLLAAARIVDNPAAYDTTLKSIPNEDFFETIHVGGPVDFDVLASLEGWDTKTFRRLNGTLSSPYYGIEDKLAIQVPVGTGEKVSNHLAASGPAPKRDGFQYRVKRGDTLGKLAIRFNVPITDIRRYNGIHGNNIRAGKNITIPSSAPTLSTASGEGPKGSRQHIVKPGDSFWTLGRRYGVSARNLARHNGYAINKTLYPGQLLRVPSVSAPLKLSDTLAQLNYVVERGDSLWSIAKRFGVAMADLKRWNPLVNGNQLRPGQKLMVQTP